MREDLKLAAVLLGYPDADLLRRAGRFLRDESGPCGRAHLLRFVDEASAVPPLDLAGHYSALFDFREDLALYLTFQEQGDARERAPALLALKELLRRDGFSCPRGELPDYLPLLLEYLAERPQASDDDLPGRIAAVLGPMRERLPEGDPYAHLFDGILAALAPPRPSGAAAARAPQGRGAVTA